MDEKRGNPGAAEAEELSGQFSLLDLPLPALALVAEHSKPEDPLLALSRGCRDAVLSQSKKISLKISSNESSSVAPTARLLSRACRTAAKGLHLDLDLTGNEGILALLLQPAVEQQEAWPNVHKLTVHAETSSYLYLVSSVMPALHYLRIRLKKGDLTDGGFFFSLQPCSRLTALHLERISVSESTAMAAAAALARLPNLRELGLTADGRSAVCASALLKHLTALTSLCLHNDSCVYDDTHCSFAPMYAAAARNPGLLSFSVDHTGELFAPAAQVEQLLKACPSLTHLGFNSARVQQDALDAILTYGTNITSLSAYRMEPDSSIADRQASWRKLVLTDDDYPTALHLADLPLQSVTSLQFSEDEETTLDRLELPITWVSADQLPGLLLRATTNLARCPVWRSKPESCLTLCDDSSYDAEHPPSPASFTPEQRVQLFQALAPVGGPHVKVFALSIEGFNVQLGREEVTALAQSLGKGLLALRLGHCTLAAGFWASLDDALPSLQCLTLEEHVICSAADIGIYCAKRPSARRLLFQMSPFTYQLYGGDLLRQSLRAQKLTHIRVRLYED